MTRTVIGVFDRPEGVDRAEHALQAAGFDGRQIHVTGRPGGSTVGATPNEEGVLSSVRSFLADLFSQPGSEPETSRYAEAMRLGWTLVKVEATPEQTDAAKLALQQAGAVDIEAKADEWRANGWSEGLATPRAGHAAPTGDSPAAHDPDLKAR
ncbi:MAG: hypothetical protein IIZ92_20055 [Aquincola sp.]|nr:hypothetical protein [Aquincola sp.]